MKKAASRKTTKVPDRLKGPRRPSGGLTATERKRSATIVQKKSGPNGGSTKARFPMPDKQHARLALADLPKAKGLSAAQKAKIRARAHAILGSGKGR